MGGNDTSVHHPLAAGKYIPDLLHKIRVNILAASSGACATIASDALMNPFDGKSLRAKHENNLTS